MSCSASSICLSVIIDEPCTLTLLAAALCTSCLESVLAFTWAVTTFFGATFTGCSFKNYFSLSAFLASDSCLLISLRFSSDASAPPNPDICTTD